MKLTNQLKISIIGLAIVTIGSTTWASGIVRGATQRLIKLETSGQPNDELIQDLDRLNNALIDGDRSLKLPKATAAEYLAKIQEVNSAWEQLKVTITQYRQNPNLEAKLIADSEAFFDLTNEAVFIAEDNALGRVKQI